MAAPPAKSHLRAIALLLVLSLAFTLCALELGLRLRKGQLWGIPNPQADIRLVGELYPGSHDPLLGFAPTPGARGRNNAWKKLVTITSQGTRSNGLPVTTWGKPVVVVGDSFTFGDEVDDSDTWPAALERIIRRPVINGGVFGYGFDQMVLRSELLLEQFDADTLIVSLIPDDIDRCEYAFRFAWKPYFEVVDGVLELRNTPVPPPDYAPSDASFFGQVLKRSFLADFLLHRLDPPGWMIRGSIRAHRQGAEISKLLVDRLAKASIAKGHKLFVLVQWHPRARTKRLGPALQHAMEKGLDVILVEPSLRAEIDSNPEKKFLYFTAHARPEGLRVGHMTPRGNQWVADLVASRLIEEAR